MKGVLAMTLLVTGFGPFDRFESNPSKELASYLEDRHENVITGILPVVYGEGSRSIMDLIDRHVPDAVICLGLNPSIGHFNLEEIALNIRASEVPDNEGKVMSGQPIIEGAPLAIRSSLPQTEIRDRLRESGIPARLSYSAGVYLCNEVFYTALHWSSERSGCMAGFIHVPMATEMIAGDTKLYSSPHMSREIMKKGIDIIADSVLLAIK